MTSATDGPENGRAPVSISYRQTPSDQRSVLSLTSRAARVCSGLMYCGDPIVISGPVSVVLTSPPRCLAIPKSTTLRSVLPSTRFVRNRFAGFTSR